MSQDPDPDLFAALARCDDAAIDLAGAALAIARDEYPDLDPDVCRARLDALARQARLRAGEATVEGVLDALDHVLFEREGFRGNADAYYDPRNSYLNDVLQRRLGIPITLSVVYLEVGWRLGLDLVPVGFPGHFLVALRGPSPPLLIDPFHAGRRPGQEDLLGHLQSLVPAGEARAMLPRALTAVPRREVIARMLRNLKSIHVARGDDARALRTCDRLVSLYPDAPGERLVRGQLYERVQAWRAAADDYGRFLELAPEAPEAAEVQRRLERIRPLAGRLN